MNFNSIVDAIITLLATPPYHISHRTLKHMKEIRALYTIYRIPNHFQSATCEVPVYDLCSSKPYIMRTSSVNQIIDCWPELTVSGLVFFRPVAVLSEDSTETMLFHEATHLLSVGSYICQNLDMYHTFGTRRQCLKLGENGRYQEYETVGTYIQNEYYTDYVAGHLYTEITRRQYETPACSVVFNEHVQKHLHNEGLSEEEIVFEYFSGSNLPVCNEVTASYDWSSIFP